MKIRQMLLGAALSLLSTPAFASFPVGVVGLVESVNIDTRSTPSRVDIHGHLVVWDAKSSSYGAVTRGYAFYDCPTGKESVCALEWADIQRSAGSGNCIGWGDQTQPTGSIRAEGTALGQPDAYPIQYGAQQIYGECFRIKQAVAPSAGGPYTVGEGGKIALLASCADPAAAVWDFNGDGKFDDGTGLKPTFDASAIDGPAQRKISLSCGGAAPSTAIVEVTNLPPVFASGPPTTGSTAVEWRYTVALTDPAKADVLTLKLTAGPEGMTLDPATRELRWPKPVAGTGKVTLTATDDDGASTEQSFTIAVSNPNAPRTPTVVSPVNSGTAPAGAVTLVVGHVPDDKGRTIRYLFTISGGGSTESSPPIDFSGSEARFTPKLVVADGVAYSWTATATDGTLESAPLSSTFTGSAAIVTVPTPAPAKKGFSCSAAGAMDPSALLALGALVTLLRRRSR